MQTRYVDKNEGKCCHLPTRSFNNTYVGAHDRCLRVLDLLPLADTAKILGGLLRDDVHVGEGDQLRWDDEGDVERGFEGGLVPAREGAAGAGRLELGRGQIPVNVQLVRHSDSSQDRMISATRKQ